MICPSCSQENPEDAVFCGDCGNALVQESPCAGCGRLNPTGLRFCRGCGHRLAETDLSPALSPIPSPIEAIQPTSFANGRYEVKRFLGEGGKKKVYLAQDTLLDREVAFALIKTEGLDEVSRTRITREAQAMGRLGSHPHIVTVFDLGDHDGQPYMVTELMGGGDVEGVIEDASPFLTSRA